MATSSIGILGLIIAALLLVACEEEAAVTPVPTLSLQEVARAEPTVPTVPTESGRLVPIASVCRILDDIPPTVRITSPPDGLIVLWGTTITISAEAEDDQEVIDWIEFVVNRVGLGAYTPAEAEAGFDYLVSLGIGAFTIEATARDGCGNTATATHEVGVLQVSPATVTGME